jgi:hypothetical protein
MSFFDLPLETLKNIFDRINIKERVVYRLVCSSWKNALDRSCMWDDININNCGWTSKHSFTWLHKYTNIFDDSDNFKILYTKNMMTINFSRLIELYNPVDENSNKFYINAIFQHHLKYGTIKSIKYIDAIVRRKYPELIEFNQKFITINCLSRKYNDRCIKWIIKKYLSDYRWADGVEIDSVNFNYDPPDESIYLDINIAKLLENDNEESAKLLLKSFKGDISRNDYFKNLIGRSYNYIPKTLLMIEVFELHKPGRELLFHRILDKKFEPVDWFWKWVGILPKDNSIWDCEEKMFRSAMVAHALIEANSEFSVIKWVVNNFYPVLRLVSRENQIVKDYIKEVGLDDNQTKLDMGCLVIENLYRMSYYIKAGNINKLKLAMSYIKYDCFDIESYLPEWLELAKDGPMCIYKIVEDKSTKILKKIAEAKELREVDETKKKKSELEKLSTIQLNCRLRVLNVLIKCKFSERMPEYKAEIRIIEEILSSKST